MNRVEVLERIEHILGTQVRNIEHNSKTRITVTPDMVTLRPGGGQRYLEMSNEGVKSMAGFVGLPWNLAARLRPETFGTVATELLGRKHRYSLMLKDGAVTAVAKPTELHSLNPTRVLTAIERGIKGVEYHRALILENFVVSLEIVGERREPVVSGDLIQAGARIAFSPLGTIDPIVQGYALRCICTNGMTNNTILREFQYGGGGGGEGDDVWHWFRKSSRAAYNSLTIMVARYREMRQEGIPADQRATMLEAMLKEAKISGDDAVAIRAMALENPPQTSYDLMNLISHASSHLLEEPKQVRIAQDAVADYTSENEHARVCPVCHTTQK